MFSFGVSETYKDMDKRSQIETFRKNAVVCADYIVDYLWNVPRHQCFPDVNPGYLRPLLPKLPPQEPESFQSMLEDFHKHIVPGTMHWQHPDMYAYFHMGNAPCNILADILITACGGVGFSWSSNPAIAELENVMLDWLCNAFGLPSHFNFVATKGKGGGCLHSTASEAIFAAVIAARHKMLTKLGCYGENGEILTHPGCFLPKLVCYTSCETHSSTQKAANLAMVTLRILMPNDQFKVTGEILEAAIKDDIAAGMIPFLVVPSVGSTGGVCFDELMTIGSVAQKYDMWVHADGERVFATPDTWTLKKLKGATCKLIASTTKIME